MWSNLWRRLRGPAAQRPARAVRAHRLTPQEYQRHVAEIQRRLRYVDAWLSLMARKDGPLSDD